MHPLERQINLLALLLAAERPLTFEQIRDRMAEYRQGDDAAAKRMFERDKDALREVGVPLDLAPTDVWEVEQGYQISEERYHLPDIDFTPQEIAALFVAAGASAEGDAAAAFQKLAFGADVRVLSRLAGSPQIGTPDASGPHLGAVARALTERRTVSFAYRRADGAEEERTVDPFGLVFRGGTWYLVGQDRDREEIRAFRLSRITSTVRERGEAVPAPEGFQAAEHVRVPGAEEAGTARVRFSDRVAWWAIPSMPGARTVPSKAPGWTEAEIPVLGRQAFVAWLAGLGPDARLIAPAGLRDELIAHLEAARAAL